MTAPIEQGRRLGEWVLEAPLGRGGFAEVWRICHPHEEGLTAAVKFFLDGEARGRLGQHEVAVLRQVLRLGAGTGAYLRTSTSTRASIRARRSAALRIPLRTKSGDVCSRFHASSVQATRSWGASHN